MTVMDAIPRRAGGMLLASLVAIGIIASIARRGRASDLHCTSINLVIGDASVLAGYVPLNADETARIRGHLEFVHDLLVLRNTERWPAALRAARQLNVERLADYAAREQFPRNDGHPDARRPTFIDARGRICAVGALFAADRGRASAESIARRFKYAFVAQIDDDELLAWQRSSGLTLEELAMIQPSYAPEPPYQEGAHLTLPFGLLDHEAEGPGRFEVTSEIDGEHRSAFTIHTQTMLYRDPLEQIGIGAFATLPIRSEPDRTELGTSEVGIFVGSRIRMPAALVRIAALLPTAPSDGTAIDARDARVGDLALQLPRSVGARLSVSTMFGWYLRPKPVGPMNMTLDDRTRFGVRLEAGIDAAHEISSDENHAIPRAGIGFMLVRGEPDRFYPWAARDRWTIERAASAVLRQFAASIETGLSYGPSGDGRSHLRSSTGVTFRLVRWLGWLQRVQPAITIAAVHTIDGWSASALVGLSITTRENDMFRPTGTAGCCGE